MSIAIDDNQLHCFFFSFSLPISSSRFLIRFFFIFFRFEMWLKRRQQWRKSINNEFAKKVKYWREKRDKNYVEKEANAQWAFITSHYHKQKSYKNLCIANWYIVGMVWNYSKLFQIMFQIFGFFFYCIDPWCNCVNKMWSSFVGTNF